MTPSAPVPVVDLHVDLPWRLERSPYDPLRDAPGEHVDLPRLRAGGVALMGAVIYTPAEEAGDPVRAAAYAERLMGIVDALVARSAGALRRVADRAGVEAAVGDPDPRGPALLLTMEGVAPLGADGGALDRLYARGLRVVGLTHNPRNGAGDGTGVPVAERRRGLTPFGREVVRRMADLRILPDIAHLAEEACGDVFDGSRGPVVCTHAGVRAVTDHWRNLSDAQIRAVAATGGAVGIDFYPPHVATGGAATVDDVVRHLQHVVELVGVRHAAVGADFCGFDGPAAAGVEDCSRYPVLAARLRAAGWREEDVASVFHGNLLRVLQETFIDPPAAPGAR